ncbi:MAG TPA: AraC family transcriptional regulator [Chitinophagaceae bacterium]|jgi:AraC-like DNA-binding protein|nr:AraC family transcriptional regulator [Chitinophagaceae bacterium]
MINLYNAIQQSNLFPKMIVNDLLFVEYTCMREETKLGIWSNNNYFAFISSGKKAWRTIYHNYEVEDGDILFVKKGANLTHQFFGEEFCAVFMFLPDDFIKSFLQKNAILIDGKQKSLYGQDAVIRIQPDELLVNYSQSVRAYLSQSIKPPEQILLLKFEELLFSLFSNKNQQPLTDYFISLCQSRQYQLIRVIEENFAYNLAVEDYARLCHMSLSTFKKAFFQQYAATPAVWLKEKKLELSYQKLLNTEAVISQVALECGFEDTSHFIRVFKKRYGLTPLRCRQEYSKKPAE